MKRYMFYIKRYDRKIEKEPQISENNNRKKQDTPNRTPTLRKHNKKTISNPLKPVFDPYFRDKMKILYLGSFLIANPDRGPIREALKNGLLKEN